MNRPEIIGYSKDGPTDQWGAKLQMQSEGASHESTGPAPVVVSDGVVGLRSPAAISLALTWAEAAKEREALATECRTKGDIDEALWLENAAAAYTRCARELLQLTGCPDNRQP